MTNQAFEDYLLDRKDADPRFKSDGLARKFVEHFRANHRIQVRDKTGAVFSGYVGITIGWRPAFILVYNRKAMGSGVLLTDSEEIVKVYSGRGI